MTVLPPRYLQPLGYDARSDRQPLEDIVQGEGVTDAGGLLASSGGGLITNIAAGRAFVRGDTNTNQGLYEVINDGSVSVTHTNTGAAHVDQIVLRVYDNIESGGGQDKATIEILQGTGVGTLDDRANVATMVDSAMLIADALVSSGGVVTLRDRRPYCQEGIIPPIVTTGRDAVAFRSPYLPVGAGGFSQASSDSDQGAVLMYLPRRIVGATKVRWHYLQGSTANSANYIFSFCDASGRHIVSTSATAFTGTANQEIEANASLTATTTFEAGLYYVFFGCAAGTASSTVSYQSPLYASVSLTSGYVPARNIAFRNTSGGTTFPAANTILGMTDVGGFTGAAVTTGVLNVPMCTLATA